MLSPDPLPDVFHYFKRSLMRSKDFRILSVELENVDAEVFFLYGPRAGVILMNADCAGTAITLTAERHGYRGKK
jgi:hypothetical protein